MLRLQLAYYSARGYVPAFLRDGEGESLTATTIMPGDSGILEDYARLTEGLYSLTRTPSTSLEHGSLFARIRNGNFFFFFLIAIFTHDHILATMNEPLFRFFFSLYCSMHFVEFFF